MTETDFLDTLNYPGRSMAFQAMAHGLEARTTSGSALLILFQSRGVVQVVKASHFFFIAVVQLGGMPGGSAFLKPPLRVLYPHPYQSIVFRFVPGHALRDPRDLRFGQRRVATPRIQGQ